MATDIEQGPAPVAPPASPMPDEHSETSGPLASVRGPAKKILDVVYRRLDETGIDFYRSAMHTSYGWPLRWLSWRLFRHARVEPEQVQRIKEVAAKGEIVYVMKHRSLLDYLYFNYLFVREGLPLPRFSNEINLMSFLPVGRALRTMAAKLVWFVRHGFLPDPVDTGWVEQLIARGNPVLLFLKRRRTIMDVLRRRHGSRDVAEAMVDGARASTRPVYAIPTVVFWERRPKTGKKTPVDAVFGEADKPRRLRKIYSFLRHYREAIVSFGEPMDLHEFLRGHEKETLEITAKKIRWVILQHIYRERKVVTGVKLMPVASVAKKILHDPEVRAEIDRTAAREAKPVEAIRRRVEKVVWKMAADIRWSWLMAADRLLYWVWNNIYSGLTVDHEGAKRLRLLNKDNPIVLVPSHKSHADYLILSYALYHADMSPPVVAAGENLSFFPMGYVFRRVGGFFIRRSFKGDALYALILERYIRTLLKAGQTLEFFIEGGRSRTGRVLRPKLGLLTMVVRAWEAGVSDDIWLSPMSINYEKVIEEKAYIRELEGGSKEKESAAGLLGIFKVLTKRYGRVFVEFAEPISLKVAFGCDGAAFSAKPETEQRAAIKELGDHIANGINGVTVVTPSQIVAAALLAHGKRGMLHGTLVETASFLLDFLKAAGVRHSPVLAGSAAGAAFQIALDGFIAEKVIRAGTEEGETYYVLEEESRISLDFYKNMVLHFFAPASFIAAHLSHESPIAREALFAAYRGLRDRLRLEFPDVDEIEREGEFEVALASLARAAVIPDADAAQIQVKPYARRRLRLLASLTHSFFEAYYAAARGAASITEPLAEKDITKRLESTARKMYRNGVLERRESTARPLLANGLKALVAADVLVRSGDDSRMKVDEAKRRVEESFWTGFLRI